MLRAKIQRALKEVFPPANLYLKNRVIHVVCLHDGHNHVSCFTSKESCSIGIVLVVEMLLGMWSAEVEAIGYKQSPYLKCPYQAFPFFNWIFYDLSSAPLTVTLFG